MKANILTLAITLTVGIILAGSLLMPVISDATETENTFTNTGLYYMSYVPENDSHELVFTPGTGWTFDGEAFTDVPNDSTIIGTDDLVIRGDGRARGLFSSAGSTAIDLVITDTTLVGTFGTQSVNVTYDKIIIAVPDKSDLVMKAGTTTAYVLKDSTIEAYGYTSIQYSEGGQNNAVFHIEGNIDDGFTITASPSGNVTINYSIENITTDEEAVTTYIGLYKITTIEFDIVVTDDDADYTTHCTYNRFIVPAEVTAELANHLNSGEIAILNALPVLIIVALVVMAAGALYLKRDD